jgi:flagellar hook-length control protein FliK
LSAPNHAQFFDLDHKLEQIKANPGTQIRIQLMPSQLGKMDLSIFSHRGLVTVKLSLGSMQAKQAVEGSLAQLESQLSAAGIKVDSFQIQVSQMSKEEATHQQYNPYSQGESSGRRHKGADRQLMNNHGRLHNFSLSDKTFEQTMVNCLA